LIYISKILRSIPLKKQEGGRKLSVTPSDKIEIFSTPWKKRVFFLTPLGHKTGSFTPLGHGFFLVCDPAPFCPILPPSDSFLSILSPSVSFFFHQFYPPRITFFTHFTPLGQFILIILPPSFFLKCYPLRQLFLRPPSDKKFQYFTPRLKTRIFSTPGPPIPPLLFF